MLSNSIALIIGAAYFGVEAYRTNGRMGRIVLGSLSALFILAGVFLAPITAAFPKVGTFIAGTFDDPSSWFILLLGLFFVLRPFWQAKAVVAPRAGIIESVPYDDTDLQDKMDSNTEILAAFARDAQAFSATLTANEKLNRAIIDDYQRMSGLELRFSDMIDKHKEAIQAQFETVRSNLGAIQDQINDVARSADKLESGIKEQHDSFAESVYAIYARERINALATEIEYDAEQLYYRLNAGEKYDGANWQQWENVHSHWQKKLQEWIDASRWYAKNVQGRILTVEDREYDGSWTVKDAQFPTADSVRRFKRHRIIQSHWASVKSDVDGGVIRVAFHGGTEKEMHNGQYHNP